MAENKNAKTPTDDGQPVAWLKTWSDGSLSVLKTKSPAFADHELEPLYSAPLKREWVDCPPCKHNCEAIWACTDPKACVHVNPLMSDQTIAWAMLAICIALGAMALIGWI